MSTISRGKKGEKKVKDLLEKDKYFHKVINDATFLTEKSEMTHQIDHVVLHEHGVFVIETKNYYGQIISDTGEPFWIKIINGKKEIISNPLNQNKTHTKIVKRILGKEVDVVPVIVFAKNNAPYMGDENVINLKDLLLFLETYPYKKILTKEEIMAFWRLLKENCAKISKKEHLENISYLKQIKKENKMEIEEAIQSGICPRCGAKIIQKDYNFKCSKCDFKFKL